MSYYSTSQRNLSSSHPNLYTSSSSSAPSSSSYSSSSSSPSLEKKTWFIGKFLCRNLDAPTYAKVSEQISQLGALKTKVKLSSRGWRVGGKMKWNSPVSYESIPLNKIHDVCQDLTFSTALLVILKLDCAVNNDMYELLAYKFSNPSTPLAYQHLFRRLTGTQDSLIRTLSRTNLSVNTLTPLAPGLHYGEWNRGMVEERVISPVGSFYKYQGHNKKASVSDLDSLDNTAIATSTSHPSLRTDWHEQRDVAWNQGEARVYVGGKMHAASQGVGDVNRGVAEIYNVERVSSRGLEGIERRSLDHLAEGYGSGREYGNIGGGRVVYNGVGSGYNVRRGDDGLSVHGAHNGHYYSQQQHRLLQVPRIGSRSDIDNMSVTSQAGVYLLHPKFKRTYVARSDGGGRGGGGGGGSIGGGGGVRLIDSAYPQQETKFL